MWLSDWDTALVKILKTTRMQLAKLMSKQGNYLEVLVPPRAYPHARMQEVTLINRRPRDISR